MSRVLMLVINPMTRDTRVEKEAATLAAAGHDVTVVATHDDGLPHDEQRDGYRILRLPYRRVVKQRVLAPAVRLRAARAARARAAAGLEQAGLAGSGWFLDVLWWLRRVLVRGRVLAGGALLKLIRTRILVPEYWGGIASRLPGLLDPPDVIHAHDLGPLAAAVRLSRQWDHGGGTRPRVGGETRPRVGGGTRPRVGGGTRPRVVYDSHELYVEQQTTWTRREKLAWKLHERRWIRHAHGVITVSPGIARELEQRYRLPRTPTVVLNSPPEELAPAASDVRTQAGLGSEDRLAVYVGTVKPGRGVDRVVAAMPHADWHLAVVGGGTGPHVADLQAQAQRLGVESRLHVLSGVPAATLWDHLATADVGVHAMEPTCRNHELALPNKLFDYLFAGLPVAVSDLQQMRELVQQHQLGTVFDPGDPVATARAVTTAAEHDHTASDDLLVELSWQRQAARLLELYGML